MNTKPSRCARGGPQVVKLSTGPFIEIGALDGETFAQLRVLVELKGYTLVHMLQLGIGAAWEMDGGK